MMRRNHFLLNRGLTGETTSITASPATPTASAYHYQYGMRDHQTMTPGGTGAVVSGVATGPSGTGTNGATQGAGNGAGGNGGNTGNGGNNTNPNNANMAGSSSNLEMNKDITMYRAVLRNELLGTCIDGLNQSFFHQSINSTGISQGNSGVATTSNQIATNNGMTSSIIANGLSHISHNNSMSTSSNLLGSTTGSRYGSVLQPRDMTSVFQYGSSPFKRIDENANSSSPYSPSFYYNHNSHHSPYSLSPLSAHSQKLLRSPRKPIRKIPKVPFKVLDAPELQDDFYLNLVDWSSTNILGVGLGTSVYLWSACTSQVTKLCDLASREDSVSSVAWSEKGNYIAVGTFKGDVQIWDSATSKLISTLPGHTARVGALAWNHDLLCSGSRDRNVFLRDIRVPAYEGERKLSGHKQEVCGLKWSPDHMLLASGGNDNKLLVWNINGGNSPIQTYNDHIAAVKAIAWSPHQHGLLASGGGTADRCIRFWNTLTGQNLQYVDTGSQVCNLAWSKHSNELVSTHGYSQNQILIWKYPSMAQLAKLTGHSFRVLYLAVSPDGEAIVTGAGDETLRFWNVFSKSRCTKESKSALNLFGKIR